MCPNPRLLERSEASRFCSKARTIVLFLYLAFSPPLRFSVSATVLHGLGIPSVAPHQPQLSFRPSSSLWPGEFVLASVRGWTLPFLIYSWRPVPVYRGYLDAALDGKLFLLRSTASRTRHPSSRPSHSLGCFRQHLKIPTECESGAPHF